MPCTYRIDAKKGIAELTTFGKVTKDEVIQRLERVLNDPDWAPGYKMISDYSAADCRHVTSSDLDEVLSAAVKVRDMLKKSKVAFVVSSELHFALLRMWALKGGENIFDLQCFSSRSRALEWLDHPQMQEAAMVP